MTKVIHIIENLHKGAVENWLVRMFCYGQQKKKDLDWTFFCVKGEKGRLDDIVNQHNGKIIYSKYPLSDKLNFLLNLRKVLSSTKYDVLHCHHDLVSAIYLLSSVGLSIPVRIVHVHNADEVVPTPSIWKQRIIREPLRRICLLLADKIIGISSHTLDKFLKGKQRRQTKDLIHYYGVDTSRFINIKTSASTFRNTIGLENDSIILLFASRMDPAKNPLFALDVLSELCKLNHKIFGVFVGSGGLNTQVKEHANKLGISDKVKFLGWRDDIPSIMSQSDLFILPHVEFPKEGLGLVVVEAQIACLRLLLSIGISDDPILPNSINTRLSLQLSPEMWAKEALKLLLIPKYSPEQGISMLNNSPFNMDFALEDLISIHER